MQTPFKHQAIKQTISVVFIWLTFQATSLSEIQIPDFNIWFSGLKNLITVSLFITLYRGVNWVYDKYLWKLFHRKYDISGNWIYTLRSLHSGRTVFGTFTIAQTVDSIEINNGKSWYLTDKGGASFENMRGNWEGNIIQWVDNNIMMLFRMRTLGVARKGSPFGELYDGINLLNYEQSPISEMHGMFNDLGARSNSRGPIILQKINKKTNEEIWRDAQKLSERLKKLNLVDADSGQR